MSPLVIAALLVATVACTREKSGTDKPASNTPNATVTPAPSESPDKTDELTQERDRMVRKTIESRGVKDERVLAALRKVPRHRFVPEPSTSLAYSDRPLPIGYGQTISQPYIVALMTEAVLPKPKDKCLEIGTGSGYQAAILAELCQKVFSIEYVPELGELAHKQLRRAGYGADRVELRTGDGYRGWPEHAPFEVIVVTAAPPKIPQPLLDQLALEGRLVVPVGEQDRVQKLELWTRKREGSGREAFEIKDLGAVAFVPFVGEAAR
jgi:protein-L-isoaspartate(D-aspartate) O-methyltransferase